MLFLLKMGIKLDGAINHLTLVVASCGSFVVFGCSGYVSPFACGVLVLSLQWILHLWPKRKRKNDIVWYIGGLNGSPNTPGGK